MTGEAKRVSILGVKYKIVFDIPEDQMPENADGCIDQSTHTIKVAKLESDRNSLQDMNEYRKKVVRHEIVHAFLYESGIWTCSGPVESWGCDEGITDWIAIQGPKLFDAFKEAGCL